MTSWRQRPGLKTRVGLDRLLVRGLDKVTAVALIAAAAFTITQNLSRLAV